MSNIILFNRPSVATSADPEYFTAQQVRLLIQELLEAINQHIESGNQQMSDTVARILHRHQIDHVTDTRRLDHRIDEQGVWINELRERMAEVERMATGTLPKLDPINELPDLSKITKLHAQYFDNRKKPNKRKGEKNHQIKLYVWTCPEEDIGKYAEGNHTTLYLPLYAPGYSYTRDRLGTSLDYLGIGRGDAKLIGCVTVTSQKPDQSAVLYHDYRLKMSIRGEVINFDAPQSKSADAPQNAPLYKWHWQPVKSGGDDSMPEGDV